MVTGSPVNIEFVPDRPGHDFRYSVNDDRIRSEFSWSPSIVFEDGISETVSWYRNNSNWIEESQNRVKK